MISCTLYLPKGEEVKTSMEAIPPQGSTYILNDAWYRVARTVWETKTKNTMSVTGRTEVHIYLES